MGDSVALQVANLLDASEFNSTVVRVVIENVYRINMEDSNAPRELAAVCVNTLGAMIGIYTSTATAPDLAITSNGLRFMQTTTAFVRLAENASETTDRRAQADAWLARMFNANTISKRIPDFLALFGAPSASATAGLLSSYLEFSKIAVLDAISTQPGRSSEDVIALIRDARAGVTGIPMPTAATGAVSAELAELRARVEDLDDQVLSRDADIAQKEKENEENETLIRDLRARLSDAAAGGGSDQVRDVGAGNDQLRDQLKAERDRLARLVEDKVVVETETAQLALNVRALVAEIMRMPVGDNEAAGDLNESQANNARTLADINKVVRAAVVRVRAAATSTTAAVDDDLEAAMARASARGDEIERQLPRGAQSQPDPAPDSARTGDFPTRSESSGLRRSARGKGKSAAGSSQASLDRSEISSAGGGPAASQTDRMRELNASITANADAARADYDLIPEASQTRRQEAANLVAEIEKIQADLLLAMDESEFEEPAVKVAELRGKIHALRLQEQAPDGNVASLQSVAPAGDVVVPGNLTNMTDFDDNFQNDPIPAAPVQIQPPFVHDSAPRPGGERWPARTFIPDADLDKNWSSPAALTPDYRETYHTEFDARRMQSMIGTPGKAKSGKVEEEPTGMYAVSRLSDLRRDLKAWTDAFTVGAGNYDIHDAFELSAREWMYLVLRRKWSTITDSAYAILKKGMDNGAYVAMAQYMYEELPVRYYQTLVEEGLAPTGPPANYLELWTPLDIMQLFVPLITHKSSVSEGDPKLIHVHHDGFVEFVDADASLPTGFKHPLQNRSWANKIMTGEAYDAGEAADKESGIIVSPTGVTVMTKSHRYMIDWLYEALRSAREGLGRTPQGVYYWNEDDASKRVPTVASGVFADDNENVIEITQTRAEPPAPAAVMGIESGSTSVEAHVREFLDIPVTDTAAANDKIELIFSHAATKAQLQPVQDAIAERLKEPMSFGSRALYKSTAARIDTM